MSFIHRGLAADGGIRVIAADTTDLVADATRRHGTRATAGAALGRTLTGSLLLSHVLLKKPEDRVTVKINGDGPLGGIIAEAGLDGSARGYVAHPHVDPPIRDDGKLNVGAAVGTRGTIEVTRSHAPYGEPFSSAVDLMSGEVAEDVAGYLARSEQIASAVLLGVYFEAETVHTAGGVILQAMPNADPAALTLLEANVKALGALTDSLRERSLIDTMHELTWGLDMHLMTDADKPLPVRYACRCSDEKALEALAYFSLEEREAMIAQDGGAEAVCHWCGETRWVTPEQIRSLGDGTGEVRCPDCQTLWYRPGVTTMVRDGEICSCGRPVELPN